MRGFSCRFSGIEMTIYRQGWFLLSQFSKTQAKNLLSQLTKRFSTPFLKNIDLNKQQSMYLTYMERDNSIWYDKKA
jgi:hypothetical protein